MEHNPVGWFEIYVNDMNRAKTFYEYVFQTQLEKLNTSDIQMWSFPVLLEHMGCTGALVHMPGVAAGGNSTLVYFTCKDCAIEELRVVVAGGKIQRSKMAVGEYGFITLAIDTEGNMFGLHSSQ